METKQQHPAHHTPPIFPRMGIDSKVTNSLLGFSPPTPTRRCSGVRSSQTGRAVCWAVTLWDAFFRSPTKKVSEGITALFFALWWGGRATLVGRPLANPDLRPFPGSNGRARSFVTSANRDRSGHESTNQQMNLSELFHSSHFPSILDFGFSGVVTIGFLENLAVAWTRFRRWRITSRVTPGMKTWELPGLCSCRPMVKEHQSPATCGNTGSLIAELHGRFGRRLSNSGA